ncbi:flagellin N-terminal helical domain-containing protein [Paenibacillus sp. FSL W7-1287]|uniref:flagellin N-terminal helical domain-containing protein n=1 Tax=Paenibacillus sp. FSL W7-1287 TaxID=2954538 RepID=UPI0030FA2E2F
MFINTNVGAMNAHRNLSANNNAMNKTMEKLSSGYRINRAADDAAGLAISEKMRFQINGLQQAQRNAQDGISLIQTAEGALTEVHAMLQRMNTLANQAANGTYASQDRSALQLEVSQLVSEIDAIAERTTFNGISLLNNTDSIVFQVGVNGSDVISVARGEMDAAGIGVDSLDITDQAGASAAIGDIEAAIKSVSEQRAKFGAVQNRLEHTINNLGVNAENLSAAHSRVRDADMAQEMTNFTKNQILVQAGTSMLAQANSVPQNVLKLLG